LRDVLASHYEQTKQIPDSLAALSLPEGMDKGTHFSLDPQAMVLTVTTPRGALIFTPTQDSSSHIIWSCRAGEGVKPTQLPTTCR
jgi:hypothetical protein